MNSDNVPDQAVNIETSARVGSSARVGYSSHLGDGGFFDLRSAQVAAFEREYLVNMLRQHSGDASRTARAAKLPRWTLYRLMKKHGINPDDFRHSVT